MMANQVRINRAPVLTLWAAVVAERLGYDPRTALTLGKAVAGLNAQSKGRRLGIYRKPEAGEDRDSKERPARPEGRERMAELLGRTVPTVETDEGPRATSKGEPIDPRDVQRYLEGKFRENLADVRSAMEQLARSFEPSELADEAYRLYEQFRPNIPEGTRGWGAAGELDLDQIRSLAR